MKLQPVKVTENQRKVIKDKYLKDSPSVEAWLDLICSNIALADILHHPSIHEKEIFKDVRYHKETYVINGRKTTKTLLHHNLDMYKERNANFKKFIKNVQEIAETNNEVKKVFETTKNKFYTMLGNWEFLPNSPTLMNAGRQLQQLSACYVVPVPDSIEGIYSSLHAMATIHQSGGGTGFDFSELRPKGDLVHSTKGISSGPLTFMTLFDQSTNVVRQGGQRRGANMGIMRYNHPEIMDFIVCKNKPGFLENFNISVAITEEFMEKVEKGEDYDLINPRTGNPEGRLNAKEVFDAMVDNAWATGDPGFVVIDRINNSDSNTTPHIGEIRSTNPCGEQPLLPWEPCFAEGTYITTDKGLEKIEDLLEQQNNGREIYVATDNKVINEQGITCRKGFVVRTGYKKVLKIQTSTGQELRVTPNHQIFTKRGWIQAGNIKHNDEIYIQDGSLYQDQQEEVSHFVTEECKEDLLYGWLSGDGWFLLGKRPCIGICFGPDEAKAQKTLIPLFNEILECNVKPYVDKNDVIQLATQKQSAISKLKNLGFKGNKAPNKEVPAYILTASQEHVEAYLSALFSADGEVSTYRRRVRFSSASPQLIRQVQLLLLNGGIKSRISQSRADKRIWYELAINGESFNTFAKKIGFALAPTKQFALRTLVKRYKSLHNDKDYTKVKGVTDDGLSTVYDIHEPITNSLIAEGMVVHNCNLGSINLSKFIKEDSSDFDWEKLRECINTATHFLDNVIDMNNYPLPKIEEIAKGNRRIGLGVMGWAESLVKLNLPYNNKGAVEKAEQVMKFINDEALVKSEALAEERGIFPNWEGSVYDQQSKYFRGNVLKPRHCARTTIAPTGTIGITAGLQGAGIEPFFAIAYTRYNAAGIDALKKGEKPTEKDTFFEVNPLFEELAAKHNYFGMKKEELWKRIEENHKAVKGLDCIPKTIQDIFLTSHDLSPEDHCNMQIAFQKHTNNAVSKTVNLKNEASAKDVYEVYIKAFKGGCKGVTIYRDGSKEFQVLNIGDKKREESDEKVKHLLREGEHSSYYEVWTGHGPMHVHINYDEIGPLKVFANLSPTGTEISGLATALGIVLSKYFQHGGEPVKILKHLNSIKGDKPYGFGPQRVDSIPHGIAKALRNHLIKTGKFLDKKTGQTTLLAQEIKKEGIKEINKTNVSSNSIQTQVSLYCPECYSSNVEMVSGCSEPTCFDCGFSKCS